MQVMVIPPGEVRGSVLLPVRLVIQSVGSGAVELGELQKHVEEKRAREKKKNNRDSKQLIPNSTKKPKKQSKLKTDQEKRQKEDETALQIADMLNANIEQTDHFPCNGGELCSVPPKRFDFEDVHRIVEHYDMQISGANRSKPINVMERSSIAKYVTEVVKRAWNCISRGQVDDALKIVNREIVCYALKYGKYDDEMSCFV
jgi:hypothetical protein